MLRALFLSAVLLCSLAGQASADLIVEYVSTASAGSLSPFAVGTDVTGLDLTRGAGIASAAGGTFNSSGYDTTNVTFADAITDGDFITFGFTSTTAYDLDSLEIRYDRSTTGPTDLIIQVDTGSGFVTIFTDPDGVTDGVDENTIDLTGLGLTGITSATFRVVGLGATAAAGTFDFENTSSFDSISSPGTDVAIQLEGTVTVPEPSSMLLLGLAGVALVARRRRRA